MRPPAQYRALHDIQVPDSYAFAARAGDDVTEAQRQNLRLIVGDDPAFADITPLTASAMERPDDEADRMEWQNYAVVVGAVSFEDAQALDRPALIKAVGKDPGLGEGITALRPTDGDRKGLWVAYAAETLTRDHGWTLDEARARAESYTKGDLQAAFGEPANGDKLTEIAARPQAEPES